MLGKLEKYYKVKIVVENPKVLNYRCTGKFKDQDGVEHVLKVIQKDHSFIYSISAEKDSIFPSETKCFFKMRKYSANLLKFK